MTSSVDREDALELWLVAGARPNFMKIAPMVRAIKRTPNVRYRLIHTGQHYDRDMSDVFFEELGIPRPDISLDAGGGSHAEQTAKIMVGFERECVQGKPDCVVVVGDVNSTLACSIVAKKLGVPVAHIEAGLRSGDMAMPEEINRLVTDSISDFFFVTEESGETNLFREGKSAEQVFFVGHVMIDNLLYQAKLLETANRTAFLSEPIKGELRRYGVVTLHRPSNVDTTESLRRTFVALGRIAERLPLVFPLHPRTRKNLEAAGVSVHPRITLLPPLPYMDFLNLWRDAALVITDSGGLQEETTALGVPCVTVRDNTERPITVEVGTNILAGTDPDKVVAAAFDILAGRGKSGSRPALWDGRAAERILERLCAELTNV